MRSHLEAPRAGSAEPAASTGTTRARRTVFGIVCLCVLGLATFLGSSAPSAGAADPCPNEDRRAEQASALPDCRAYEMVTPPEKGSGEPQPVNFEEVTRGRELDPLRPDRLLGTDGARTGLTGDRMAWVSHPLPDSSTYGVSQLSTRGAAGWSSDGLVPPMSVSNDLGCSNTMGVSGWSQDLSKAVLDLPAGPPRTNAIAPGGFHEEAECGHPEPSLVSGEPEHLRNLFVRDNMVGSHSLVNLTPDGVVWPEPEESLQRYWPASFLAGSDDLSHVVFEEELKLTDDAPTGYRGGDELYEWTEGEVRLVTYLPGGTAVHGSLAGATRNYAAVSENAADAAINVAHFRNAVSADGSRIFFESPGDEGEGDLYLREDGESTVRVDAAEPGAPGSSGGGDFQAASADGSRVLFTSDRKLTTDSTAEAGKPDLYEYEVESGDLRDLTVNAGEAADVLGVSGVSQDGSHVYFVAKGLLTADTNSEGVGAVADQPNLYLSQDGAISFIATLDATDDECDWTWNARCAGGDARSGLTARVSNNGQFLGFNSVRSLTAYENKHPESGEPLLEVFRYDAAADELSCASCKPDGTPMRAGAAIKSPSNPGLTPSWRNRYPQQHVSENGQVFFETADALLPRDSNGRRDVYQYADGELTLISSGTGESGSHFLDATPDGTSVFISTAQRLLPGEDTDTLYDYYVARVNGGFPQPPPPSPSCEGDGCRGAGTAASETVAGTSAFRGRGNLRPHGSCRAFGHRARKLSQRAKRLRRNAKKVARNDRNRRAVQLNEKARRLGKRAQRLSRHAKRCRRANRRAGR